MYGKFHRLSMFAAQPLHKIPLFCCVSCGFLFLLFCMNVFVTRQWDFSVYYMAGYAINHGLNPYDRDGLLLAAQQLPDSEYGGLPYLYPPITAHLFQPFACLSFFDAKYVWYVLKCIALEVMILMTIRLTNLPCNLIWLCILHAAAVWFRPIHLDFNAGNMAVFEAVLIYVFFWLWKQQRFTLSALVLTLSGSIKVTPFLIALYPLHLRQYRFLIPVCGWLTGLGLLTIVNYGNVFHYFAFYRSTLWLKIWDEQVQSFFNCSSTTVILRTFTDTYFARPIIESNLAAGVLIPLFPIVIFISTGLILDKALKRNPDSALDGAVVSILIMTLLLIPPRLAGYSLAWLFLPVVCLIKEAFILRQYVTVILIMISLYLLQAVIPPEHVSPGLTQLLIDKDFFGLLALYTAGMVYFQRKSD